MNDGPVKKDNNPYFEEESYLTLLTTFKFMLMISVMITITASYLQPVTA